MSDHDYTVLERWQRLEDAVVGQRDEIERLRAERDAAREELLLVNRSKVYWAESYINESRENAALRRERDALRAERDAARAAAAAWKRSAKMWRQEHGTLSSCSCNGAETEKELLYCTYGRYLRPTRGMSDD